MPPPMALPRRSAVIAFRPAMSPWSRSSRRAIQPHAPPLVALHRHASRTATARRPAQPESMAAARRTLSRLAHASLDSLGNHNAPVARQIPGADSGAAMSERRKPNRKALNVRLDPEVINRLKRVARDAAGIPVFATVTGIVEAGILVECERIEGILRTAYAGAPASPPPLRRPATLRRASPLDNHRVDPT